MLLSTQMLLIWALINLCVMCIAISISLLDKILLVQVNFHRAFETCEPLTNPTMDATTALRVVGNHIHIDCDRNSNRP